MAPIGGLTPGGAIATSIARLQRIDPLGALLGRRRRGAVGLPFVVFKANRILPGDACTLLQVLPIWAALACDATLLAVAAVRACASNGRVRLAAALLGLVVVALAVAAAGNALTPAGNASCGFRRAAASGCCSLPWR